jgi:hypothetical protein
MIIEDIDKQSLKSCCATRVQEAEIAALFDLVFKNQQEINDRVQCIQRAIALLCATFHDFKAERFEDVTEIKQLLSELLRKKTWIPREAV